MNPNYYFDRLRNTPLSEQYSGTQGVPQTLAGLVAMENARNYAPAQYTFSPQEAAQFDQSARAGQADLAKWEQSQRDRAEKLRQWNAEFELRKQQLAGKPELVQTEQGMFAVDTRTGKAKPVTLEGMDTQGPQGGTQGAQPFGAKPKIGRALPGPATEKLAAAGTAVEDTQRLSGSFKEDYGNKTILGDLSNTYKRVMGDETGQAQWWQDMDMLQNQTRHALFGSALTATELKAWEKTSINPRMDSEQIRQNLQRRQEIEARAASKMARAYSAGGYNQDQIKELLGGASEYLEKPAAPARPVGGSSMPKMGQVVKGYVYLGGDPSSQSSWKKAQ